MVFFSKVIREKLWRLMNEIASALSGPLVLELCPGAVRSERSRSSGRRGDSAGYGQKGRRRRRDREEETLKGARTEDGCLLPGGDWWA
jgi:hypothetical protein